jgi:hypothetical protein
MCLCTYTRCARWRLHRHRDRRPGHDQSIGNRRLPGRATRRRRRGGRGESSRSGQPIPRPARWCAMTYLKVDEVETAIAIRRRRIQCRFHRTGHAATPRGSAVRAGRSAFTTAVRPVVEGVYFLGGVHAVVGHQVLLSRTHDLPATPAANVPAARSRDRAHLPRTQRIPRRTPSPHRRLFDDPPSDPQGG